MSKRVTDIFDFGDGLDYYTPAGICSLVGNDSMLGSGGVAVAAKTINQSIRFNDDDSAYMYRTPSVAGNRKTCTWSGWVKRGNLGATQVILGAGASGSSTDYSLLNFSSGDQLQLFHYVASGVVLQKITTAVYRDPSAWYHVVYQNDSTQATAEDRFKLWVNGVRVTDFGTNTIAAQNTDSYINSTVLHTLERHTSGANSYGDGYLADVHFIDGAALTAASFGETDIYGNWVPIAYAGTDATTDFIPQSDGTAFGNQTSGGGLATAFDGDKNEAHTACAYGATFATGPYVGKDWGVGTSHIVSRVEIVSSNNVAWEASGGTPTITHKVYGSNSSPANATDGTLIHTFAGSLDSSSLTIINEEITTQTTAYRYHWITADTTGNTGETVYWAEIEFFEAGTGYGTNGFHVTGENSAALGTDYSGNSNTFTTSGLTTADQMLDSPTDDIAGTGASNYATLNPLKNGGHTIANGNLNCVLNWGKSIHGTIGIPVGRTSDKFVFEAKFTAFSAGAYVGLVDNEERVPAPTNDSWSYSNGFVWSTSNPTRGLNPTRGYATGEAVASAYTYAVNDVLGFEVDCSNGDVKIYKNGTYYFTQSAIVGISALTTDRDWFPTTGHSGGGGTGTVDFTFIEADMAHFGSYAAGSKTICTGNLPAPAITVPTDYFNTKIFTGTGAENALTFGGINAMQPDLVWIKDRDTAVEHVLTDAVRGATKELNSDSTLAETTVAQGLKTFDADGFTLGTDGNYNTSSSLNVAWAWKANGAGASNTDGSITATVSADTTSGFSIGTFTGTGANATVGHGLTSTPEFIIIKNRINSPRSWIVYHKSITATNYLRLNSSNAASALSTTWNDTDPTTSVINLGTGGETNEAVGMVAYAWHSVEGYSKFGSYTGNGSADGPFVNCGFRPAFVMIKCSSATGSWHMFDDLRAGYNVDNNAIMADTTAAEVTTDLVDIVSTGFKLRIATAPNTAATYIYAAFAEHPFGGDGVSQARAR